jgi:predicted lipoprotein with Yx(FWY)xxD motif
MKLKKLALALGIASVFAIPVLAQDATPAATESGTEAAGEYTVNIANNAEYGNILVGPTGMTLYTFSPDGVDSSVCEGQCAKAWPPLTVKSADELTGDEEIPGAWSTFARADGSLQVAYNGQPLYYWFKDEKPGDATGNRVGHNWWVVPPATVSVEFNKDLGQILMGPKGMTVYMFTADTQGATTSACTGDCAKAWPAVTVASADDLVSGTNLPGAWATITRDDGTLQVTYNGWPLYYYAKDTKIGDTMGEGVGSKWYTVHPETLTVSDDGHLVSFDGMSVYTFDKDTAGTTTSACTGDCLKSWPVVPVGAKDALVAGKGVTGKLATIAGADGKLQLTYNGWPLYYFAKDTEPKDTMGDGVGGVWHLAKP